MKKWLIFGGGVLTGIVLTFLLAFAVASYRQAGEIEGLTIFEQPGEVMESRSFEVFQSLAQGAALTHAKEDGYYMGPICLLVDMDGKYYYDDEIVNVPIGKVARQIGIYQYTSKNEVERTVPVVRIMDK